MIVPLLCNPSSRCASPTLHVSSALVQGWRDRLMQERRLRSGRAALLHIAFLCAIFCLPRAAEAQRTIAITGDRLSGFVLPVEPLDADIRIKSLRGSAWSVDDTRRLLLEGDVVIEIGNYQFDAQRAVVWIN